MSEIHLLRHAKAAPPDDRGDRERPLEQRGRRAAQAIATWVAEHRLTPDIVLCSPSVRTRQTLDIVASAFLRPPQILLEDGLYLAPARQLLARLRQLPASTASVMIVGHNPGFHELANNLSDVAVGPLSSRVATGFPTGALASYEIGVTWPAIDYHMGRLIAFVTPKEIIRGID